MPQLSSPTTSRESQRHITHRYQAQTKSQVERNILSIPITPTTQFRYVSYIYIPPSSSTPQAQWDLPTIFHFPGTAGNRALAAEIALRAQDEEEKNKASFASELSHQASARVITFDEESNAVLPVFQQLAILSHALNYYINQAEKKYRINPNKLIVSGYSSGAVKIKYLLAALVNKSLPFNIYKFILISPYLVPKKEKAPSETTPATPPDVIPRHFIITKETKTLGPNFDFCNEAFCLQTAKKLLPLLDAYQVVDIEQKIRNKIRYGMRNNSIDVVISYSTQEFLAGEIQQFAHFLRSSGAHIIEHQYAGSREEKYNHGIILSKPEVVRNLAASFLFKPESWRIDRGKLIDSIKKMATTYLNIIILGDIVPNNPFRPLQELSSYLLDKKNPSQAEMNNLMEQIGPVIRNYKTGKTFQTYNDFLTAMQIKCLENYSKAPSLKALDTMWHHQYSPESLKKKSKPIFLSINRGSEQACSEWHVISETTPGDIAIIKQMLGDNTPPSTRSILGAPIITSFMEGKNKPAIIEDLIVRWLYVNMPSMHLLKTNSQNAGIRIFEKKTSNRSQDPQSRYYQMAKSSEQMTSRADIHQVAAPYSRFDTVDSLTAGPMARL